MRPHRRQPTRLPPPWDSPGKSTGVGCHFLLQCMKGKSESEVAQLCLTLRDAMDCSPPGSSVHGIFQSRVLEWVAIALQRAKSLTQLPLFFHFLSPSKEYSGLISFRMDWLDLLDSQDLESSRDSQECIYIHTFSENNVFCKSINIHHRHQYNHLIK